MKSLPAPLSPLRGTRRRVRRARAAGSRWVETRQNAHLAQRERDVRRVERPVQHQKARVARQRVLLHDRRAHHDRVPRHDARVVRHHQRAAVRRDVTVPSTWTRQQRSYMNSRKGKMASANSSSIPTRPRCSRPRRGASRGRGPPGRPREARRRLPRKPRTGRCRTRSPHAGAGRSRAPRRPGTARRLPAGGVRGGNHDGGGSRPTLGSPGRTLIAPGPGRGSWERSACRAGCARSPRRRRRRRSGAGSGPLRPAGACRRHGRSGEGAEVRREAAERADAAAKGGDRGE